MTVAPIRRVVAGIVMILATATGAAAEKTGSAPAEGLPFLGIWDCEVAFFVFTPDSYAPGEDEEPLIYRSVEAYDVETQGAAEDPALATEFVLTFEDDYQIGLSGVTAQSMVWFSGASGDAFDCIRVDG